MERSTVALVRCDSYDVDEVYAALKRGVDLLGGLDRFVRAGEQILLKPNLLAGEPPEKAVTTHPALLEASVRLLGEAGATCCYGDSPGRESPAHAARGCGMVAAAERCGIEMADFPQCGTARGAAGRGRGGARTSPAIRSPAPCTTPTA